MLRNSLFLILCALLCGHAQAQTVKLYPSAEDYIKDRYQTAESVTLESKSESFQKKNLRAPYVFEASDPTVRYEIRKKIFLVDYNDSLYMNLSKISFPEGRKLKGFAKLCIDSNDQLFFEAVENKGISTSKLVMSSLLFGAIGATIVLNSEGKKQHLVYYYYDAGVNEASILDAEQITTLLQHDQELLKLYQREVFPEDPKVILLYARAFFKKEK